jgi:two-component system sensor histidine kinase/response regulator
VHSSWSGERASSLAFDACPRAFIRCDRTGKLTDWNLAAEALFGWSRVEALGRDVADLLAPAECREAFDTVWRRSASGSGRDPLELVADLPALDRSGRELLLECTTWEIDQDGGSMCALVRDVTAERDGSAGPRVKEERFRLLVESVADYGIFMLDPDGMIASWNAGAARMKGYSEAEAVGQHFSIFYTDEQRADGHPQRELEIAEAHGRYEEEAWRVRKDGSLFWASVVITPVYGADGGLRGFSKVTRDRTDHMKSEAKFEGLLEAAPDAMVGVNSDGLIRLVNAQAEKLFGYPREELLGKTIETLVPDRVRSVHPALRSGYFRAPVARPMGAGVELFGLHKDGTEFPAEISLSSIDTEEGAVVTAAVRDVTERRVVEAALATALDTAQNAVRSRPEFLANMSHEIRTPMNAVIGMTSLLLDTDLNADQRDYVETVRTSGEHLLTIINDILDFAKIDAGKLVIEELTFVVRDWLRDSLELVAAQAHEKGLEMVSDVAEDVPHAIVGDPARLRQVLVNLLTNAVKFTPEGEVVVRVAVDHAVVDGAIFRLTVKDTGIGVSPERIESLFDPFTQADSTTTRVYGGTGLGLAISQELAHHMRGAIDIRADADDAGTIVSFTFFGGSSSVGALARPDLLRGQRLLIVDDNGTNRKILSSWAARRGMNSVPAENAAEALGILARDRDFAFALIDLKMPDMDGAQLGELLRIRIPSCHLILLSSAGCYGREVAARDTFAAALSKPVDVRQLFNVMSALLRPGGPRSGRVAAPASIFDAAPACRSMSILVVDDAPMNQKVAVHLLARFGARADVAASGPEALVALEQRDYDLVFMDVQMPEMDGIAATRMIRGRWPKRPIQIVAMTANVAPEDVRRCLDSGMDGFLGKPIIVEQLAHALYVAARRRMAATAASPSIGPVETHAPAAVDVAAVRLLREQIGSACLNDAIEMFLTELDVALADLREACQARDAARLATTAHKIKGPGRTLGATAIGTLMEAVEAQAVAQEWARLTELVGDTGRHRDATRTALRSEVSPTAPTTN